MEPKLNYFKLLFEAISDGRIRKLVKMSDIVAQVIESILPVAEAQEVEEPLVLEEEEILECEEPECEESIGEDGELGESLAKTAEADEKLWKECSSSQDSDYHPGENSAASEEHDSECVTHDCCIAQAEVVDELIRQKFDAFTCDQMRLNALCELICDHYRSIE